MFNQDLETNLPSEVVRYKDDIAGAGIRHAEYNLEQESTRIFQIWIAPSAEGGSPAWGVATLPQGRPFRPTGDAGERLLQQQRRTADPRKHPRAGRNAERESVEYALGEGYLVSASGAVEINGERIDARGGAAIKDVAVVRITAVEDAEVVMVDTP
jgi:quercetin 2,3-dioxygenase